MTSSNRCALVSRSRAQDAHRQRHPIQHRATAPASRPQYSAPRQAELLLDAALVQLNILLTHGVYPANRPQCGRIFANPASFAGMILQ